MSREGNLVKNTFIISFGTIIPKLASFITLPIITAGLSKAEYGTYDLINTLVALFLPLITLQIQAAAFRFLIEKRTDKVEISKIVSTIIIFIAGTSAVGLLCMFFALRKLSFIIRSMICVYFFVDVFVQALQQIVRGINKNKVYSESTILQSLINMILIVTFIKWKDLGLIGTILAITIACSCSVIFMLFYGGVIEYFSFKFFSKELLLRMLSYSWPLIPNSLSLWVMNISDRLIVTIYLGIEVNAVYAVANKIPSLFAVVQNTFTYAWQENASINSGDDDVTKYYSNVFDRIFCLLVGIMALLIAGTPILFRILIRGDYGEAYNQMPILFMGVFFSTLSSFLGGIYIAKKKTKSVGITTISASLTNFLINIIFVRLIGIYAASLSTVISYVFLVIYRMIDIQKFQKLELNKRRILLSILILVIMCFMCFKQHWLINLANIVLAMIVFSKLNIPLIKKIIQQIVKLVKKR